VDTRQEAAGSPDPEVCLGAGFPSAQGLESTHNGHSRSLLRTSVIGSQSGRSMAAISWASVVNYSFLDRVLYRAALQAPRIGGLIRLEGVHQRAAR